MSKDYYEQITEQERKTAEVNKEIDKQVIKSGIYSNNKNKEEYLVRGFVIDCTNERNGTYSILYHKQDSTPGTELYFVREIEEFKQKFTFNRFY